MRRNLELEATIAKKYAAVEAVLDERGRRLWTAAELRAIGYGGDALVCDATGVSRPTISERVAARLKPAPLSVNAYVARVRDALVSNSRSQG